jgi:uncharacterized membrane protein YeaQ/YmgE (transglycosylase-associated protein family)
MDMLTWAIVGLIAGVLAGLVIGGYGIIGDIVIGMVGALLGGYVFARAGWQMPMAGIGGQIIVAFLGAVVCLIVLHLLHAAMYGFRRPKYWSRRPT